MFDENKLIRCLENEYDGYYMSSNNKGLYFNFKTYSDTYNDYLLIGIQLNKDGSCEYNSIFSLIKYDYKTEKLIDDFRNNIECEYKINIYFKEIHYLEIKKYEKTNDFSKQISSFINELENPIIKNFIFKIRKK